MIFNCITSASNDVYANRLYIYMPSIYNKA